MPWLYALLPDLRLAQGVKEFIAHPRDMPQILKSRRVYTTSYP
jgi:hypothetical protein